MMKKLCMVLVLLMSVIMSGCFNGKDSNSIGSAGKPAEDNVSTAKPVEEKASPANGYNYDIEKATYSDKKIIINYPQLRNLSDGDKQKRINELIKTAALESLENYKDNLSGLSFNLDFEVKLKGPDILSIQYLGLAVGQEAAYPVNIFHTTNIDLAKEKWLSLSDIVTVNDSLVKKFIAGKYKTYRSDLNLESAGALKEVLNGLDGKDLMEGFKKKTAEFYFTKQSLVLSVEVAHAVGDHLEMELAYKDLNGLLLVKPDPAGK